MKPILIVLLRLAALLTGVASEGAATIYLRTTNSIETIAPDGSVTTILTDPTDLNIAGPFAALAVNTDGTIFFDGSISISRNGIPSSSNWLDSYQPGGSVTQVINLSAAASLEPWEGLAITPNKSAYVYSPAGPEYSIASVNAQGYGPGPGLEDDVLALTANLAGNLYYISVGKVNQWTPLGVNSTYGNPVIDAVSPPNGFAADSNGDVFVSGVVDGANGVTGIFEITPKGTVSEIYTQVGSLAVDASDDLYIDDDGTLLMKPPGGQITTVSTDIPYSPIAAAIPEPSVALLIAAGGFIAAGVRFRGRPSEPF